jgi:hypothetical protein
LLHSSFRLTLITCQTQQLSVRPPPLFLFAEYPHSTQAMTGGSVTLQWQPALRQWEARPFEDKLQTTRRLHCNTVHSVNFLQRTGMCSLSCKLTTAVHIRTPKSTCPYISSNFKISCLDTRLSATAPNEQRYTKDATIFTTG